MDSRAHGPSFPEGLNTRFQKVYNELRRLAQQRLGPGRDQSLPATALVHEAYVRLVQNSDLDVVSDTHFFALAAQAMRWILVDRARKHHAAKRFHVLETRTMGQLPDSAIDLDQILSLDEALSRLQEQDARKCEVVMLRYFAGLSIEDAAAALAISPATVKREWNFARAWLLRAMRTADPGETGHEST